MRPSVTRSFGRRLLVTVAAAALLGAVAANAAPITYSCLLDGPSEAPPNASPGTGFAIVETDAVAHTMHVHIEFANLIGTTSACHIHGATASPGTGTAGVMTTTPTFAGFPGGVTAGIYDIVLDMTQASSYNPSFLNNAVNLGSTATAEATLFAAIADGKAYVNVHSSAFPGGEIRGFLLLGGPTPAANTSWGRVKKLYR